MSQSMRSVVRLWLVVLVSAIVAAGCSSPGASTTKAKTKTAAKRGAFTLWQLPNQTRSQMMSYVLRTSAGKLVVIDGGVQGDAPYLKGFLAALGNDVEAWIVSHAHDDHFGALIPLLAQPDAPRIKTLYGSLPDLEWVNQYGCGAQDTQPYAEWLAALRKANLPITELSAGADFRIDEVRIEVLGVRNLEITNNAINNSSIVWRMSDASKSILFLGDLGVEGGRKLLSSRFAKRLHADYVQMAHHGQNGVEEVVYQAINPSACLWTAPPWLWENDSGKGRNSGPWKTLEVRAWMDRLGIQRHDRLIDGLRLIR